MAVYKRGYRPYQGPRTAGWERLLVLPRYAWQDMFGSRFLTALFVVGFFFPLFCAVVIYLHHNLSALTILKIKPDDLIPINADFFLVFCSVQSVFGFFLTAFVGPGLVSPDLTNNALALYLCRPLSRAEYVIGKMSALAILLSLVTWVPGLLLFAMQSQLAGAGWLGENLWVAGAILASCWIWIFVLALLTLALSAWVKWKLASSGLLFGVFYVLAGFSHAVNAVMDTRWGHLMNIGHLIGTLWSELFRVRLRSTIWSALFQVARGEELPLWGAIGGLALVCWACLWLLDRKVRACEVVR